MAGMREMMCILLCTAMVTVSPAFSTEGIQVSPNAAAQHAAYQHIVGGMDLNRQGDVAFYDLTYILSKLFKQPQNIMNIYANSSVKHSVLMDILWVYCKMDTTLIERNYANETEYLTYEQLFDALNYFYFDILAIHGYESKPANVYRLADQTQIIFDDGSILSVQMLDIPDGRATAVIDGQTVIEVCPVALPYDLSFSSMDKLDVAKGKLYYYSEQEKNLLLTLEDGTMKRFEIIGNPACFAQDGVERSKLNSLLLDQNINVYYTTYKKAMDVITMVIAE